MRQRTRVVAYKQGSKGAKALSRALGGMVLKLEGSRFKVRPTDTLINWGNTSGWPVEIPRIMGMPKCRVFNQPEDIRQASNKLLFFQAMTEAGNEEIIPRYWSNRNEIPEDAYPIVCRTVLAGHSGSGIVIADSHDDLVDAPLYVEYVKKVSEFRIHVGRRFYPHDPDSTLIISQQEKKRRLDHENPNWQVRNHANGFIYARSDVNPPQCVLNAARRALEATELDFGAVDVIYNEHTSRAYVLEVNTAPGLEGSTVEDYKKYFKGELND